MDIVLLLREHGLYGCGLVRMWICVDLLFSRTDGMLFGCGLVLWMWLSFVDVDLIGILFDLSMGDLKKQSNIPKRKNF